MEMNFEIYGDSIRAGYGLKSSVYCAEVPGYEVKNFAYNGATVFDLVEDVYTKVPRKNALALVGIGVNDLIYGRDPDRIFERLVQVVLRLQDLDRKVIVEALLPVKKKYFLSLYNFSEAEINEKIKRLNDLIEKGATKYGYYYLPYDFSKKDLSTKDGLHPDEKGNDQIKIQFEDFIKSIKIS